MPGMHLVVDCTTGEETREPIDPEVARINAAEAEAHRAAQRRREQAIEVVRAEAATSPAFTALLEILGLNASQEVSE